MQNHVRKSILGLTLVAALSMTIPAMAAARNGDSSRSIFTRIRTFIAHILDVDESKLTLPPG
jgi:hypothetical protein